MIPLEVTTETLSNGTKDHVRVLKNGQLAMIRCHPSYVLSSRLALADAFFLMVTLRATVGYPDTLLDTWSAAAVCLNQLDALPKSAQEFIHRNIDTVCDHLKTIALDSLAAYLYKSYIWYHRFSSWWNGE